MDAGTAGATTIEADEAAVFRALTRRAKQVVVVADSSKVGMVSHAVICSARDIDVLITDDGISDEAMQAFAQLGVKVVSV